MSWTSRCISSNGSGPRTDAYVVTDTLASQLTYWGTTANLSDGTPLVAGTHYTVAHEVGTNTVTVTFTEAGLDLLADHDTARVNVVIDTVINAVGEISNTAEVYPNQSAIDSGKPVATPSVSTKYGNATIQKTDSNGDVLAGATFKVYRNLTDALAGANAVEIGGVSTWTSDDNGLLTISGLRYSNVIDGVTIADQTGWAHYYLVEVAAPAGYELLAQPVAFDVLSGDTAVDLTVENVRSNGGFQLPLTGANGTATIILAGGLLLTGAVLLSVRSRRVKAAAQA